MKKDFAPAAVDEEGSDYNEDEEINVRKSAPLVGHKAEIERIRLKIEENKEKGLSQKFFKEAKRLGRIKSSALMSKMSASRSVVEPPVEIERSMAVSKSRDYLKA